MEREHWWSGNTGGEHEVTFALELNHLTVKRYTGECWCGGCDRDAWKAHHTGPRWLTGTIDYLLVETGCWVDDLKTGEWPVSPVDNKQLLSYALYPWVLAGCPLKYGASLSITTWKKYRLDAPPTREEWEATGFDLHEHLEDLRWAATHPDEVNPTDDGCRFCECKPGCPAMKGIG